MILYLNCYHAPTQVSWTKADYLMLAAKRLGWNWVLPYQNDTQSFKNDTNPEYVLNIEPFQKFIKGSKWTGIWEIDISLDRSEMNVSDWIASDTVLVANSNLPSRMKIFQGEKIVFFQACDPTIHKRMPLIPQKYDFVFSGSAGFEIYKERSRMMDMLRFHKFTFQDFGKGHSLANYVRKINEGKVQFIRSVSKTPIAESQVEQRFFECLAIGPVLKDYHPDLEELGLVESKDFFWYRNDSEMIFKMRYLIDNPDFAKQMAANGRRKALLYHTYDHRLVAIKNIIQEYE